ncbi:MAG: ABC transporter ATP-binding protein [Chloroflexi bacterium]|nr:ABC transporter ATP-binding protein [Chloroflexota bacterium]
MKTAGVKAPPLRAVLTVENVSKWFGETRAVEDLSLTVRQGELLALLGPSGCGKTTTLRLIAGFERPNEGTIALGDRVVASRTAWVPPDRRGMGMVFQDYALFPNLTVAGNVSFGLPKGTDQARRVGEVLSLAGLTGMEGRYPHELSGGQQQRVALARALAPRPLIVLLDEPFSNLDADLRAQTRREVRHILKKEGATAILVTHDQEEAFVLADTVAVLNEGHVEQIGTPEEVYHVPATRFAARFVGLADFLSGEMDGLRVVTELGVFTAQGLPFKGRVEVLIRPDDVDYRPDPSGDAVITEREFWGSENRYTIRLPSGRTLRSSQPSTLVHPIGERVRAIVRLTHVVTFPRA